jgi:hypothetical protein
MRYEQAKDLVEKLVHVAILYHASEMLRTKIFEAVDEFIPDMDEGCFERGCPAIDDFAPRGEKVTEIRVSELLAMKQKEKADMVNHPTHYKVGGIETIDYMKAKSTPEEFKGHLRLTAIKYLSRTGYKDDALQDLKKAQWYLNKLVQECEANTPKQEPMRGVTGKRYVNLDFEERN